MSISESLLALALALALPSCTPGDACLRHSDCDKDLVCTDGTCAKPPVETLPDATSDGPTAEVGDASLDADASDSGDSSTDSELDAHEVSDSSVSDGSDATDGSELDAADADSAMDSLADSFEVGG